MDASPAPRGPGGGGGHGPRGPRVTFAAQHFSLETGILSFTLTHSSTNGLSPRVPGRAFDICGWQRHLLSAEKHFPRGWRDR